MKNWFSLLRIAAELRRLRRSLDRLADIEQSRFELARDAAQPPVRRKSRLVDTSVFDPVEANRRALEESHGLYRTPRP